MDLEAILPQGSPVLLLDGLELLLQEDVLQGGAGLLDEGKGDRGRMGEHGALADAYATYDVLVKLLDRSPE